jgi:hypothetical protein
MFSKIFYLTLWSLTLSIRAAPAEWTILLVMQGDNNLSYFMHQNIERLKKIGSSDKVNILVQWDEPIKHTTWRYKICRNHLVENASLSQDMGENPEAELIDAARWAFTKYPAKKRALIFWNHGSGVLDEKHDWKRQRGILYDFSSAKCLTNDGLLRSMKIIQQEVLAGEMLDLIGMDACLMAMLEIAYQIKDFTKTFVASENIEHAPGWDYDAIFRQLIKTPKSLSAQQLAHLIVRSFERLHKKSNNIYTQSFIDLTAITELKENVATFASICLATKQQEALHECITYARKSCTEFDKGHFIDLYDFYRLLLKKITNNKSISPSLRTSLEELILEGTKLIEITVVGHTKGHTYKHSHGLSIYFPRTKKLHLSYQKTLFAEETLWPAFIDHFKIL